MACVTIQISDYLDNKRDRRGTCKECKMEVFWTVANLASHKRKNCIIPEEEKAQWSDPYVSVTLRNLDDYLENKNPITRRGTCISCGFQVYWTNLHLAGHKRTKCNIPDEERSEWDPKASDDGKYNQKRNLLNIASYLENKNSLTRKGNCKMCGLDVYWTVQCLVKHKRKKCVESEVTNEMWLNFETSSLQPCVEPNMETAEEPKTTSEHKKSGEVRVSSSNIISEYLQDKNISTRRGTCRVCFTSVFWTISHLSLHKLRKCPIPESEKESWINLKEKLTEAKNAKGQDVEINIGDYLTDKNILTRRGTCKVCQKRVYWATLHLASHKKSKCPISEEEKAFWSTLKKGNSVNIYVVKENAESVENYQNIEQEVDDDYSMFEADTSTNDDAPTLEQVSDSNGFKCQYCDKVFKSNQSLLNHENVHTNPLICDYCQKTFSTKHYLTLHIFTHLKESTKKNYKDLEKESNFGRLVKMFDGNQENSDKNLLFEEVLIKQEGHCGDDPYNMNTQVVYEPEVSKETSIEFECCRRQFGSFIELTRHQYSDHTEIFQLMLESMRDEISQLLSLENVLQNSQEISEYVTNESNDFSECVEAALDCNLSSDELADDFITPNVNVECFICQRELPALSYDKHLSSVHPLDDAAKAKQASKKFCCSCCTETFPTITLCISHLKKAWHQYTGTSCNICLQDGFCNLRELNEHRKATHEKNKVPTCETCQKTFKTVQNLKLHTLKHKGMKPAFCSSCGYKTVNQETMDRHMIKHENEPESVCPHCGRTFLGILKLRRHVFDAHKSPKKTPEERWQPLFCKHCGLEFFGKDRLKGHISRVHRERKFACDDCDKLFLSQRLLNLHRIVHTQEIKFFCDLCGKGFTRNNTLRKHMQTHDDSTLKLFCNFCTKAFRDKRDLERHIKVHKGQKDYGCAKCAAAFFDRNGLQKHMLKFHGHGLPNYKSTKITVAYKQNLE